MAEQLFDFDNPWRPNYEAGQTLGWFGAVGICIVSAWYLPLPTTFATVAASGCSLMGFYRMAKAWTRHSDMARTNFTGKTFIDIEGLKKASKGAIKRDELWLGNGYQAGFNCASSKAFSSSRRGFKKSFPRNPSNGLEVMKTRHAQSTYLHPVTGVQSFLKSHLDFEGALRKVIS